MKKNPIGRKTSVNHAIERINMNGTLFVSESSRRRPGGDVVCIHPGSEEECQEMSIESRGTYIGLRR